MNRKEEDEKYMRRCIQLARNGAMGAAPNPMVGAVIVCDGKIIGEGYHRRCGQAHAEVNAIRSVRNPELLTRSTIYVSLEPCSHYGKTPPCADLIIEKRIPRVVVGCIDPFARVSGRGIQKLRDAGVDVTVGVLERECLELNKHFVTFNERHRPYVLLKWCMSADGFLDDNFKPTMFSTPFTQMLSHKLRAEHDAILVGRVTAERDKPRLDVRLWSGPSPMRIVIDRGRPFSPSADFSQPVIPQLFGYLYDKGVQSLIVEGGAETHRRFLERPDWWDEIRVETSPKTVGGGTRAPRLPDGAVPVSRVEYGGNAIAVYKKAY